MTPAEKLAGAFSRTYPSEVARIVEAGDSSELAVWMAELPSENGAALLARVVPVAAAEALRCMPAKSAASLVAELSPNAAAAVLRRVAPDDRAVIVAELPAETAERLQVLMRYEPGQAASRVDARVPAVAPETTVSGVLEAVRRAAGAALNYVYVVDDEQRLVGVASMRELMLASTDTPVREVMTRNPYSIAAEDPFDSVVRHPGWRKAHAMPVVDGSGRFLGVIRYSQFRAIEAELGKTLAGGSVDGTSAALAELFWLGTSAMARLGEAALLGRLGKRTEAGS
jgi:Mg/Co/Ni transporter MgtE